MRAEFIRDSEHTRRDVNFHNYAIINLSGFVVLHADYEYIWYNIETNQIDQSHAAATTKYQEQTKPLGEYIRVSNLNM